jgi:hypothetical protein
MKGNPPMSPTARLYIKRGVTAVTIAGAAVALAVPLMFHGPGPSAAPAHATHVVAMHHGTPPAP